MARYTGSVCRLCRREKTKLYLKGDRCYTDKCAISRRNYEPGQHGQSRKKLSNHATQLREKQKVKRYYGLLENKFRTYFETADQMHGVTGENLLKILESRLDNVVYRLGLATSRAEARQLVVHGHFLLNGQKATVPSMQVSKGDVIEVKTKSKSSEKFKAIAENHKTTVPQWMEVDVEKMTGRIVGEPVREDIELPIEEHLIVEWYSK